MSKEKNKKKTIIKVVIVAVCIAILIFAAVAVTMFYAIHEMGNGEDLTCSYDGKYGYVQLSSPKKWICTVNLYDMDPTGGYKQTLHRFYRQWDMDDISWGNQSYDLFFLTDEAGPYLYTYLPSGQWLGPLYLADDATIEKQLSGDTESYCFEVGVEAKDKAAPEYGYGDIIVIKKDTIPKSFLERIDSYIDKN